MSFTHAHDIRVVIYWVNWCGSGPVNVNVVSWGQSFKFLESLAASNRSIIAASISEDFEPKRAQPHSQVPLSSSLE